MKFTTDGKEYEFRGLYRPPRTGDFYLDGAIGNVVEWTTAPAYYTGDRAIVHPIPPPVVRHTFGGVVFEETGEVREAAVGEWHIDTGPRVRDYHTQGAYKILRPVAIESCCGEEAHE